MKGSCIPRDPRFDATRAVLRDPYRYISRRALELGSDLFETRLLLRRTLCMTGREAAEVFYDPERFERHGAAPVALQKTLFGEGGVQGLDGAEHAHRKQLFLALMTPERIHELAEISSGEWRSAAQRWRARDAVVLYPAAQEVLTRTVCRWAGVPLRRTEVAGRTRELAALFDWAGSLGPRHLAARLARRRSERWAAELIERIRRGQLALDGESASVRIALHRDLRGNRLEPRVAAVELLNVLRPTIAVAVYVTLIAHALDEHPALAERIRFAPEDDVEDFVQEVRRFYPFFPAVPAIVRRDFEWQGFQIRAGRRALLDLYGTNHDPRIWGDPELFRPERFRSWLEHPFELVPQGGGDAAHGHRCPGEAIARALMQRALRFLSREIEYALPTQDLRLDFRRLPALPASGVVLRDLRMRKE
jgi:fatty-acid peroxygenase